MSFVSCRFSRFAALQRRAVVVQRKCSLFLHTPSLVPQEKTALYKKKKKKRSFSSCYSSLSAFFFFFSCYCFFLSPTFVSFCVSVTLSSSKKKKKLLSVVGFLTCDFVFLVSWSWVFCLWHTAPVAISSCFKLLRTSGTARLNWTWLLLIFLFFSSEPSRFNC